MVLLILPMKNREAVSSGNTDLLRNKLPFHFSFHEPLTEALLHCLPATPAAIVDCRDDLEGP